MKQLTKNAVANTQALVSTKISYFQAWIHHKMCFIPSVSYPLSVCNLSKFQLHLLQLESLLVLKNKQGSIKDILITLSLDKDFLVEWVFLIFELKVS